ncbi:grasp-with-spasm system SPASM domain peptide maturase [Flavobacterium sp. '19STA2R22 D10 B1']|uniref:grasp-with-spasm system SPASM domain peptide maturase n=1 Tax=Flavobacterium aerium TaxID=3037261 RepID=UPI00278C07A6|nr:grasp-with-spasm system SPASM domain peptide maturase [Flavobacterium sp. '19STA2R22 D10 B1']
MNYFLLYTDCILVKGIKESLIIDLQRHQVIPIPNLLYEILNVNLYDNKVNAVKKIFNSEYDLGIDKYFNYLVKEEIGFYTDTPKAFPKINLKFELPFHVYSSIINLDNTTNFNLKDVLGELLSLGCQIIELRINNKIEINYLKTTLNCIKSSRLKSFEIIIKNSDYYSEYELIELVDFDLRISITALSSIGISNINERLFFSTDTMYDLSTTKYSSELFVLNMKFFTEAQKYNTALNKKVCIDSFGNIKNHISHDTVFGNINQVSITKVISKNNFTEKWKINNDHIEVCKDCQYRYICFDDSDIIENNGKYKKKETCSFNPYTNLWENSISN